MQELTSTQSKDRTVRKTRSDGLVITPARRKDMSLIAEFVRSSAHWYEPIVDEKDMAEHAVDEKWAEVNFARRDFYLGHAKGTPVGTISMQYFGDYAYLGYIYLHVDHVGKGYGGSLMRFAESVARDRGMRGMCLIAHPEATWARRAYLKFGFEVAASSRSDVLRWQDGALRPYYEEGFELYLYQFPKRPSVKQADLGARA